jgi:phosphoribosylglycinamide formyltransferase-1
VSDSIQPLRVAVLASGRGSNLQMLIDAQRSGELPIAIVGVYSDRADSQAVQRARAAGLVTHTFAADTFDTRR